MGLRIMPVRMFMAVTPLVRVRPAGQAYIELRRRNPAAAGAIQAQFVTFDAEFQQLASQRFEIEPAIQHRADEHVAARAGETVQIKRSCHPFSATIPHKLLIAHNISNIAVAAIARFVRL
jgi:hypothetical protein